LCSVSAAFAEPPLTVSASNYPLAYFAERIGGDAVDVDFPVPGDIDPAFWKPDADDIAKMQAAELVLLNGAGYEHWLGRVSLPSSRTVNTSRAFRERYLQIESASTHNHGPSGEHAHKGTAFVTWLDLSQADEQAQAVRDAFIRKRPQDEALFANNFRSLQSDLRGLDENMKRALAKYAGRTLIASHPVYQYLERRFRLDIKSMAWEPDINPNDAQWFAFREQLEARPATVMLWEAEPTKQISRYLEELGIAVAVFDPAANVPSDRDFIQVMKSNIDNVNRAGRF
jgi:zinc transport system substrate-binding protein